MKYYRVHDLQGASFMDYTHETPMTASSIRSLRWSDYVDNVVDEDADRMEYKHFTMDFIADLWQLEFEEVTL